MARYVQKKREAPNFQLMSLDDVVKYIVMLASRQQRIKTMQVHRRHDISDRVWANIESLLPGAKGCVERSPADNQLFINAVFWILRMGAP